MSASSENIYFDLYISGVAYLNRVREVPANKAKRHKPFLACTIAALNGPSDDVAYKYIDCTVPAPEAAHWVRKCKADVDAERKVLIGFRASDPWIDPFVYKNGERAGKPGYSWKARLLFIAWIKIDGELVYKAEAHDTDEAGDASDTGSAGTSPASSQPGESAGSAQSTTDPLAA